MLKHKHNIEDNRDVSQRQLDRVSGQPTPILLQVGIDAELRQGKYTAYEVEEDLIYRPPVGGFVAVVCEDLWHVFDEGDDDFDV